MACKRVNCAESLTRLVLKNHVQGVEKYISNLGRSLPMEMYITILFASLQQPLIEHNNLYQEGREVAKYILKKPGDHEHLSLEALIEEIMNTGPMQYILSTRRLFAVLGS